ncbi:ZIP family metal transporter [Paraclostridium bifermentans]|uniref:ZIP family metal transporter n=1 Tax=Paraclostridium bifermentans TaxID=1490 RepID=UPI0011588C8F|nr:ZIP family metal transporter [Paraclostridium bifermentans]TQO59895.1 ZIP family metal transporter [Paraclostridium bifermentans]
MFRITLIGLISGVIGTGIGGIISTVFRKNVKRYISFFMGISGGVMLAVVVFDLLKESMNQIGVIYTSLFVFAGALLTMLIKNKLEVESDLKSGYLIFLSILLHNLPEGLAIGSSFIATENLGITLAIVIGIHNIPEGLAMALSLAGSKMSTFKVVLLTLIAGIPMGIGSFFGAYLAGMCTSLIGGFLAIAAGTMMYVVLEEIFPSAKSIYSIIGFLIGILVVSYI